MGRFLTALTSSTSNFSPMTFGTLVLLFICCLVLYLRLHTWLDRKSTNLPPGPPRGLFGDNTRDVAGERPWKTYAAWHQQYGHVISFYIWNTPSIVLGSYKAASELLVKRGSIYSSRPRNIMSGDLLSGGMRGLGMQYGTRWRNWRYLMHSSLSIEAAQDYKSLQAVEASILLRDLLVEQEHAKYSSYIRRFAISVVTCVAYGHRVTDLNDKMVLANQEADEVYTKYQLPGRYIVESWPILLYVPRMLQWFRREPERQRAIDSDRYMLLMNNVKAQMQRGTAPPSVAKLAIEKQSDFGLNDLETAYALSSPWMAGVGTTSATIDVFFLAMLHNPSVMRKAQAELDSVIGMDQLPTFDDIPSLPYIQALINETTRWRPISPAGIPHAPTQDDVYEGMFIPKGSAVYANIYAITKDPELFPEPNEFRPERFLNSTHPALTNYTISFGFGRRICPGMYLAQQSLFIAISRILWAFDVVPLKDETGRANIPSDDDFVTGLVSRPQPFGYSLVPRRESVVKVVTEEAKRAIVEATNWQ